MLISNEIERGVQTKGGLQRGYENRILPHADSEAHALDFLSLYEEYKAHLRANVKESSCMMYTQRMDGYIVPYFGKMCVTEVKPSDILKWQNSLSETALSHEYKKSIRSAFHHFFSYLAIYGIPNPLTNVKGFKKTTKKKEMPFWTQEEFEQFISCVDDFRYKVVFAFLFLTGCRKGEALALRWDDIDFVEQIANIHGTLTRATDKERNVNEGELLSETYRLTSPKTENSYRKVILPPHLLEYLRELKKESSSEFVFGADGKFLSFNTLEHAFNRYIVLSGVKKIRIHDLRHSHVSLLINKGGDNQLATLYIIAARIGDTVDMVLKTYGHMFPNRQRDVIHLLNFAF